MIDPSNVLMRQALSTNHQVGSNLGEVEIETRAYTKGAEESWNQLYVNQETEMRHQADMLANNIRSHNHHTQNILTGLQGTASTHEQVGFAVDTSIRLCIIGNLTPFYI